MLQIKHWLSAATCSAAIAIGCDRGATEQRHSAAVPIASSVPSVRPQAPAVAAPPSPGAELEVTRVHRQSRFSWRQIRELNWQAVAEGLPALPPLSRAARAPAQRRYRERWVRARAALQHKPLRFCIDRYEFPNLHGEFPLVAVTFAESEAYCARPGKRLCTESEWTFACEGPEGLPYPYGYERDKSVCNIDVLAPGAPATTFQPRTLPSTARGIDFAWHGRRSGESPRCLSPFGVEDLTGNVDEWTRSVRRYGYRMIMKGGHWAPAQQRCRPQTRGHGPRYLRYDRGFRCCQNFPD